MTTIAARISSGCSLFDSSAARAVLQTGDYDYAWINCSNADVCGLLNHVVHDGAKIDRNVPIALEVGGYGRKGDWIETDCPKHWPCWMTRSATR